jgi:hypothetical protein
MAEFCLFTWSKKWRLRIGRGVESKGAVKNSKIPTLGYEFCQTMEQHLAYIHCLTIWFNIYNRWFMKVFQNSFLLVLVLAVATLVGVFRGNEAKQRWIFKIKSRFEEKRHLAERKKLMREGQVALDDIEIAAFHNN